MTLELETTLLEETAAELDKASELEDTTTTTLELKGCSELELWAVTAASLDWAASVSASNSANRSRGWANADTAKRLATQAIRENMRIPN